MDQFSYLITAEVPARGPIEALAAALQQGYDNGAEGRFQVIVTTQPTYLVIFLRTTAEDDADYLRATAAKHGCGIEQAAALQLAAELADQVGEIANPVVDVLRNGDVQIVDFNRVLSQVLAPGKCQRCGSALADGLCTDATCPFSDVPQDDPAGWAGHPEKG
ncbi:hypothetical protein [Methylibium petroleiphilum]|uniref:Uncharacterized protein n=1 Tax=Methylibium petroleiphilum (strain ATCC BAA-1232 / LMG 22953 / PM1) TaxID=420662 RepID=A2SN72_METPP|nr:hypothetical protein [Methylibium petroleiphilum]ABM97011.1 hypothetical protein Mpe_B0236 [Methylibium petroleiphilum PM1]